MATRTCDYKGHVRDLSGGRVCESGHFICKECVWGGTGGGFFGGGMQTCPLCRKRLR